MSLRLCRVLYKGLLRRGRQFDRYPLLKAWCNSSTSRRYYNPHISFEEEVRSAFRKPLSSKADVTKALNRGLKVYRTWGNIYQLVSHKVSLDSYMSRSAITQNTDKTLSPTPVPQNPKVTLHNTIQPGSVLISHPRQAQKVILILKHDSQTTVGLILDKQIELEDLDYTEETNSQTDNHDEVNYEYVKNLNYDNNEEVGNNLKQGTFQQDDDDDDDDEESPEDVQEYSLEDTPEDLVEDVTEDLNEDFQEDGTLGIQVDGDDFLDTSFYEDNEEDDLIWEIAEEFGPIYGGGTSPGIVVLHEKAKKESQHCVDDLYYTFQETSEVIDYCRDLQSQLRNFRIFYGITEWNNKKLEKEMQLGWWFNVKCPLPLLFNCQNGQSKIDNGGIVEKTGTTEKTGTAVEKIDFKNHDELHELWSKLLRLLGGEYWHFAFISESKLKKEEQLPIN